MPASSAAWLLGFAPNAVARIETKSTGRDSAGGVTETWGSVVTGVQLLISQTGGGRPGMFDAKPNKPTGTATGFDDGLNRADVRLVITSGFLAGRTLTVESVAYHPAGQYVPARYTLAWSFEQPAT
jgi:hypothetical protein